MSVAIKEYRYWGGWRIETTCDYCKKEFNAKRSHFQRSVKHYCSMNCYHTDRKENWKPYEQPTWKGGITQLESSSQWRKRNRHKTRHYKLAYYARKKGAKGSHSIEQWTDLKERYGNKCAICLADGLLTKDHIIPLSKGGSDYIENIQPLCRSCNSKKHNHIYESPELLK